MLLVWVVVVLVAAVVVLAVRGQRMESRLRRNEQTICFLRGAHAERERRLEELRSALEPELPGEEHRRHRHLRGLTVVPVLWAAEQVQKRPMVSVVIVATVAALAFGLLTLYGASGNGNGRQSGEVAATTTTEFVTTTAIVTTVTTTSPDAAAAPAAGVGEGATGRRRLSAGSAAGRASSAAVSPVAPATTTTRSEIDGDPPAPLTTSTTIEAPPTSIERCLLRLDVRPLADVELACRG